MDKSFIIKLALLNCLQNTTVTVSGEVYEIKKLVDKINNLKIHIYSNDHNPPHFHVLTDNINASFNIKTGELINGTIDPKDQKRINYFYKNHRETLLEIWKDLRTDLLIE
jgi:hypothetical protein